MTLDWTAGGPHGAAPVGAEARPCVLCEEPALLLSPRTGQPCHKLCAEAWLDARPERAAAYEQEVLDLYARAAEQAAAREDQDEL